MDDVKSKSATKQAANRPDRLDLSKASAFEEIRRRSPWMFVSIAAGVAMIAIGRGFEQFLAQKIALVSFPANHRLYERHHRNRKSCPCCSRASRPHGEARPPPEAGDNGRPSVGGHCGDHHGSDQLCLVSRSRVQLHGCSRDDDQWRSGRFDGSCSSPSSLQNCARSCDRERRNPHRPFRHAQHHDLIWRSVGNPVS